MFVTAVCFLFLLKLKWPKNKNILINLVILHVFAQIFSFAFNGHMNVIFLTDVFEATMVQF